MITKNEYEAIRATNKNQLWEKCAEEVLLSASKRAEAGEPVPFAYHASMFNYISQADLYEVMCIVRDQLAPLDWKVKMVNSKLFTIS